MATVIEASGKNQFPAYVGQLWSMSQRLVEIYIAEFMKTCSKKNTAVLLKQGQTRVRISPMSPKITENREKREREREREKKRLATVFSFYSVDFERQKTSAEGHSQTLTQSDLVFINPGIYIYIYNIEYHNED